ncbi:hypothetical protein [Alicyclobacillus sendaiensis]|uniref:hypothetical protein n=1 Tax=Alicyclobacillus sendaiensis TaxID=192387 RepID=UPI0026F41296|nr:hypothetical protein [Alicyclobacillus sendaiensis]
MSEKVAKLRRKIEDEQEAIVDLANMVQALQDEVLLLNIHLSALTELMIEGRPVTKAELDKRKQMIFDACKREWERQMAEGGEVQ